MGQKRIYEEAKDTAKKIRARLKKEYPELTGSHFRVRSSVFAGGDSVTVSWEDYPSKSDVDAILREYQSSSFDSMQDLSTTHGYIDPEDGKLYAGAKFVTSSHRVTQERKDKALDYLLEEQLQYKGFVIENNIVKDVVEGAVQKNKKESDYVEWKEIGRDVQDGNVLNYRKLKKIQDYLGEQITAVMIQTPNSLEEKEYRHAYEYINNEIGEYNDIHLSSQYRDVLEKLDIENKIKNEDKENETEKEKIEPRKDTEAYQNSMNVKGLKCEAIIKKEVEDLLEGLDVNYLPLTPLALSVVAEIEGEGKDKKLRNVSNVFLRRLQKEVLLESNGRLEEMIREIAGKAKHQEEYERELKKVIREHTLQESTYKKAFVPFRTVLVEEFKKEHERLYARLNQRTKVESSEVLKDIRNKYLDVPDRDVLKLLAESLDFKQVDYKEEIKKSVKGKEDDYLNLVLVENINDVGKKDTNTGVTVVRELNKDVAVAKDYSKKATLANEVLTGLLKGKVGLIFIKADGTERYMSATRDLKEVQGNGSLMSSIAEWNVEAEIRKEIERGTISVVDVEKQAPRKFTLGRLEYFQVEGGEVVKVERKEAKSSEEELKKYFDPTKITTAKMIDILGKKVVRLVFKKKDGSLRPMVATRNSELVELYSNATEGINKKPSQTKDDSAEAVKRQIERDFVSVFDLSEGEFRSFKPSTIERYDTDLDISSWLEFTILNDAWYDIARNGADAAQYFQEGKRGAKSIGSSLPERKKFEEDKKQYVEDLRLHRKMMDEREQYAKETRKEAEIMKKRRQIIKDIVNREAKEYVKNGTEEKDEAVYRELVKVPDILSNNIAFNNMDNEITQVKNFDAFMLVAMQVRSDVFYLHPTFIINALSGRVYLDNTEGKVFSEIGNVFDSDADWGSEDVLEPLAKKIGTKRKKKSMFNLDEGTEIRVKRMISLAEQNRLSFSGYGMILGRKESPDGMTEMLSVVYKGNQYLLHPDLVIQVSEGKGKIIFKVERTTSRVREFGEFFAKWVRRYQNEQDKKVVKELGNMYIHALDLRKTVKDVS